MQFEKGSLYHIYNQGNNRQKVFFNRGNYLFFLKKIKVFVSPYADILAWCLMPNHFHLMVLVNFEELSLDSLGVTQSHAETKFASHAETKSASHAQTKFRTFNASIGIMLMSYTKAINKQNKSSGKLFREATKAECINCPEGITPSFFTINGITQINILTPEEQYPQVCFNYIHQNPVEARLVNNATDWEFSSAKDYAGLRKGRLIDKNVAGEYIDL